MEAAYSAARRLEQLRQLSDARCNLSRLIFGHEINRNTSTRLRLEVDIPHGEIVSIASDEAGVVGFFERPWRRERRADII
jgi:hypothetical protein